MKNQVTLREEAYEKIKKSILIGELEPNSIIYETNLAKKLGMSRTPVREAMMRLLDDGLLKNLPSNGFLVPAFTVQEINEIFDLRMCLEKFVAEELFNRNIFYDVSILEEIIEVQKKTYEDNNYLSFFDANRSFHLEFVKMLGNRTLAKVMEGLRDKPIQSGYIALKNKANIIDAVNEHFNIVKALKESNKEEVIKEIIRHTNSGKKRHMGLHE